MKTYKYEVMYIIDNDTTPTVKKSTVEKINTLFAKAGKVRKEEIIGKKELAYEIRKKKLGYYVLLNVNAESDTISEFERLCNIDKNIVRYIAIKQDK